MELSQEMMIPLAIAFLIGAALVWIVSALINKSKVSSAADKAKVLLKEAEAKGELLKQEKIMQAKEKFLQLKSEHEQIIRNKEQQVTTNFNKFKQKENNLAQKMEQMQRKANETEAIQENLNNQLALVKKRKEELDKSHQLHVAQLEKISNLSAEEAKAEIMTALKDEAKTDAMQTIKEIVDEAKMTANQEAKKVVIQAIQRVGTEQAIENSVTVFNIESDEVKGRIIGREGRNIRALEAATGVEIIVDDTPEAIILSCFDPVRREIARLSLHTLVTDGRIHPARIEEIVGKVSKRLEEEIIETGKRTTIDLGIHGLAPELIRMVGRMKYRSSYGQNLLQHSREVAKLCAIMAGEMGINTKLAKRAGLLHDIGKVPDDNPELPHAILGMQLAEKAKENKEVCNAIGAHHDEIEMTSLISPIVQVCDAISGARPGARREIVDQYLKRLKDLESLALGYPGVETSYAIQAVENYVL